MTLNRYLLVQQREGYRAAEDQAYLDAATAASGVLSSPLLALLAHELLVWHDHNQAPLDGPLRVVLDQLNHRVFGATLTCTQDHQRVMDHVRVLKHSPLVA